MKPPLFTHLTHLAILSLVVGALPPSAGAGEMVSTTAPIPVPPAPTESGLADEIGAELSIGYDTVYMFRGVDFGDDLVWSDVNVTLPLGDSLELNVGAWYATLVDDDYTELDLYGGITYKITDHLNIGAGYTWYYFPRTDDEINEVGATIGTSLVGLDLGFGYYYDFEIEGSYFELSGSYKFTITDAIDLVPEVTVGSGDEYYGVSGGNHVGLTLSLPIQLTSSTALTPYIAGNLPIDALEDLGEEDQIYGGFALSVTF